MIKIYNLYSPLAGPDSPLFLPLRVTDKTAAEEMLKRFGPMGMKMSESYVAENGEELDKLITVRRQVDEKREADKNKAQLKRARILKKLTKKERKYLGL